MGYRFAPYRPPCPYEAEIQVLLEMAFESGGSAEDEDTDRVADEIRKGYMEIWEIWPEDGETPKGVFLIREGIKRNKRGEGCYLECVCLEYMGGQAPGLILELLAFLKAEYQRRGLRFLRITGRVAWLRVLKENGGTLNRVFMDFGDHF